MLCLMGRCPGTCSCIATGNLAAHLPLLFQGSFQGGAVENVAVIDDGFSWVWVNLVGSPMYPASGEGAGIWDLLLIHICIATLQRCLEVCSSRRHRAGGVAMAVPL